MSRQSQQDQTTSSKSTSNSASPGKLHGARWITLANRILRLYCSARVPSTELERLVEFLVNVYVPAWFDVVQNPSFLDGPRCFHRLLQSLDAFPFLEVPDKDELTELDYMKACVNNSAYWSHPECVLISMLTDPEEPALRNEAVEIIKDCRKEEEQRKLMRKAEFELRKIEFVKKMAQFEKKKAAFEKKKAAFEKKELEKNKGRKGKESQPPVFKVKVPEPPVLDESVREFHVTEVGWKGKTYRDFLNGTTTITEPPVTLRMSMAEVEAITADPSKLGLEEIPCHTQCVERMIALDTFVAKRFPAGERFEQEVSNILFSHQRMSQFKSSGDWRSHKKEPRARRYSV